MSPLNKLLLTVVIVLSIALAYTSFPPPEPVADITLMEAPVLTTPLELQQELNRRDPTLNLAEDGICGPATMQTWDAQCNTQYALEMWPE